MSSRPAVVGGFILGALGLGVAGILFFGGMRFFATSVRAVVFFPESVAGLEIGSPVTFRGVRVGSVQSIAIRFSAETMTAQIPVYLELAPTQLIWEGKKGSAPTADLEGMVQAGLRAQLALESFVTGQMSVDLEFRPDTPASLVQNGTGIPEIPTLPSDLSHLRNQLKDLPLRELAESAQKGFASLERLSNHLDATIDPLARSMHSTLDAATQTLQTTDEAVAQVQADAHTALRDLDALLIDAHLQLDGRASELSRALTDADRTVRKAETLLDSLNGLAESRSQFRSDLEAAMRDLAATASSLRNFAETVEQNPNALLMGRSGR